jgi:TM2 domain-containing membrane protein YozV
MKRSFALTLIGTAYFAHFAGVIVLFFALGRGAHELFNGSPGTGSLTIAAALLLGLLVQFAASYTAVGARAMLASPPVSSRGKAQIGVAAAESV